MLKWHHNRDNNEVVEFSLLHEDIGEFMFLRKCMPHAMQTLHTGDREVLNWTAVDVGEPGLGQVRLRQRPQASTRDIAEQVKRK